MLRSTFINSFIRYMKYSKEVLDIVECSSQRMQICRDLESKFERKNITRSS